LPVTTDDLSGLSTLAGFDVTTFFISGDFNIVNINASPPQSQTPLNAGFDIWRVANPAGEPFLSAGRTQLDLFSCNTHPTAFSLIEGEHLVG
jgi:hypothetical protein